MNKQEFELEIKNIAVEVDIPFKIILDCIKYNNYNNIPFEKKNRNFFYGYKTEKISYGLEEYLITFAQEVLYDTVVGNLLLNIRHEKGVLTFLHKYYKTICNGGTI